MKLVLEIDTLNDARLGAIILQRAFPEAFETRPAEVPQQVEVQVSPIVAPDGTPAAPVAEEKPARVRERRASRTEAPKAAPVAEQSAPQIKLEDVRAAARSVRNADGAPDLARVREILTRFNATRIDGLKAEQYAAFIAACGEKQVAAGTTDIGL